MPLAIACCLLVAAASSALAGDLTVEDQPLRASPAPETSGGPAPVPRDCKVIVSHGKDASGLETETTRRVCHWAVPPS